jgi:hypothetical protein
MCHFPSHHTTLHPVKFLFLTYKILKCSDKAVAAKTAARMLSSNTVPYVRHLLYVAKCEAVTLTDFSSNSYVRNCGYCDDYKVLLISDNNNVIIMNNMIDVIDMIHIIDIADVGIIVIIIVTIIYDGLLTCLNNFMFRNTYFNVIIYHLS